MNFSSFRLSHDIVSLRSLRDIYLHRTTIFISDRIVSVLKDLCNRVKGESRSTDLKVQREAVVQSLKQLQIRQYIKDHFNCGESDSDKKIDDFYHELDIFINLEIRLISQAAFCGFDQIGHYNTRTHYYEYLNHLFEVGKTIIISETKVLEEFLVGRNRRLVRELIQACREEMVAFAPVPNREKHLYRPQALNHQPSSLQNNNNSSNSNNNTAHTTNNKPAVPTPRVRFQPILPTNSASSLPVAPSSILPSSSITSSIPNPNTAKIREQFLEGGATYEKPPSPLGRLLEQQQQQQQQQPTIPPTSTRFKEIWLSNN